MFLILFCLPYFLLNEDLTLSKSKFLSLKVNGRKTPPKYIILSCGNLSKFILFNNSISTRASSSITSTFSNFLLTIFYVIRRR